MAPRRYRSAVIGSIAIISPQYQPFTKPHSDRRNPVAVMSTSTARYSRLSAARSMRSRLSRWRASPLDSHRLANASSHTTGTAAVDLASDSLDSGATRRREPAPPVALVSASPGQGTGSIPASPQSRSGPQGLTCFFQQHCRLAAPSKGALFACIHPGLLS